MARIGKSDLIEQIVVIEGVPATKARAVVNTLIERIKANLEDGNEVAIQDFGVFKTVDTPARTMNDTLHGKGVIQIPARRKAKFTPSKNLLS